MPTRPPAMPWVLPVLLLALFAGAAQARAALPRLLLPEAGLQPRQLAVVVNTRDPLSREIGDYYLERHHLPAENRVEVDFDPGETAMSPGVFAVLQKVVEAQQPEDTRAYLLAWAQPYRVGCMSVTSAFAFGYDRKYCAQGCTGTAVDPYAIHASLRSWEDFRVRPGMLLAATSVDDARALIDRGADSAGWYYRGAPKAPAAYLVETSDRARSVRRVLFPAVVRSFGGRLPVRVERAEGVEGAADVMFYFTGARRVEGLGTNRYLPGAAADHLTSTGGRLTDSLQMSAIEWLRAGATGSYGTVVEPCNMLEKFPDPGRLMQQYLAGRTLLEAYWKSVLEPGQGVFIGDPLAAPFRGYRMTEDAAGITVETAQLLPGRYRLEAADSAGGPFGVVAERLEFGAGRQSFRIAPPYREVYRLQPW